MDILRLALKSFLLIALLATIHITAINIGFYQGKVWIDIPLHIIGGYMLGLIWIWILDFRTLRKKIVPDFFIISVTFIGWVLLFSYFWEYFEFLVREYSPELASTWKLYPPNLSDSLSDLAFGLLGGLIALVYARLTRYRKLKDSKI